MTTSDHIPGQTEKGTPIAILDTASACCLTLKQKGCEISYKGVQVDLISAGRSADLTGALLDIGLVSLHLGAPGILDTIDLPRCRVTVSILMDYAIDIAPRIPNQPNVIDGAQVMEKAREMRSRFVDPGTDPDLIRMIGAISQMSYDGVIDLTPENTPVQESMREQ